MNILPKKNWHVLKKENIDRVRRDEAAAAEQEKARLRKIALAEKEARTELLRQNARRKRDDDDAGPSLPVNDSSDASSSALRSPDASSASFALSRRFEAEKHVDLFTESQAGAAEEKANKERELEEKQEQEAWERKVGILCALGQTADGPLDNQLNPWWMRPKSDVDDSSSKTNKTEVGDRKQHQPPPPPQSHADKYDADRRKAEQRRKRDEKRKRSMDPMAEMEKQLNKKKKKKSYDDDDDRRRKFEKKEKKKEKEGKKSLEELRAERLARESKERVKTLDFLAGGKEKGKGKEKTDKNSDRNEDKNFYNSQFFPELARKRRP